MISDIDQSFDLRDLIPRQPVSGTILLGTVGWNDTDLYYEQGKDGTEEDGYTLVRVTCLQGHSFIRSSDKKGDGFQGKQILCHIAAGLFKIPARGDRVYVAVPSGLEGMDCAGVIFATVAKSPFDQFGQTRAKLDFGADTDLMIKARSVTISDYENNFCAINGGIKLANAAGTILNLQDAQMTGIASGGIVFLIGTNGGAASAFMSIDTNAMIGTSAASAKFSSAGAATILGTTAALTAGSVSLGLAPAMGVVYGPTGITGVGSLTVFTSP